MKQYKGKTIFEGYVISKAFVIKKDNKIQKHEFKNADEEYNRFIVARQKAIASFEKSYELALKTLSEEEASLFQTHKLMAEDGDFEDLIKASINENHIAEEAILLSGEQLASMFASLDDEYMKERANDVKEVASVIANILKGVDDEINLSEPSIIICEDLEASKLIKVDKSLLKGVVFLNTGVTSHVSIFTRTLEIPSICSINDATIDDFENGETIALDAIKGIVYVKPDEQFIAEIIKINETYLKEKAELKKYIDKPSISKDGKKFKIYANIASSNEAEIAYKNNAEGIGLFRSEFIYLESKDYPSEDEQFAHYKKVLEVFKDKQVIVRTFDIGADKKADYFDLPDEENPALGYRSIRICRDRPEMFLTQMKALLRASHYGNLAIMVPMIISLEEIDFCQEIMVKAKAELKANNIPFNDNVPLGIMIETPAAAILSDEFAKKVDFFSIGTNDLSQYSLACDRLNHNLDKTFNPHHKAILRLINLVIENAHKAGISVGMCGELARDPILVPYLMKMGLDEFSISSSYVLKTRKLMSNVDTTLIDLDKLLK